MLDVNDHFIKLKRGLSLIINMFANYIPAWFIGYDIILEVLFMIVSFVIALYARKVYQLSDNSRVKLLSIGFLLIGYAYMAQSITNYLVVSQLNEAISNIIQFLEIEHINYIGVMLFTILMSLGLIVLTYMTFKKKEPQMIIVMFTVTLIGLFFSTNLLYTFYVYSTIYLGLISYYYLINYLNNKDHNSLLTLLAFVMLFFGSAHFTISIIHGIPYVIGHLLNLIAYLMILINLYLVKKK